MSSRALKVTTKSGSVYLVDQTAHTVHRVSGGSHYSGRAVDKPMRYESIKLIEVGKPMSIYWGSGCDEYSPMRRPEDCKDNERYTHTSVVVSIEPAVDCTA